MGSPRKLILVGQGKGWGEVTLKNGHILVSSFVGNKNVGKTILIKGKLTLEMFKVTRGTPNTATKGKRRKLLKALYSKT